VLYLLSDYALLVLPFVPTVGLDGQLYIKAVRQELHGLPFLSALYGLAKVDNVAKLSACVAAPISPFGVNAEGLGVVATVDDASGAVSINLYVVGL
jgi:hypothetical protein